MVIANHYDDMVSLYKWVLENKDHAHEYHALQWEISFDIGDDLFFSRLTHLKEGTRDDYGKNTNGDERSIEAAEFWTALKTFVDAHGYALAYDYDFNDQPKAEYVAGIKEENTLYFSAAERFYESDEMRRVNMRFRCFSERRTALAWVMALDDPEVFAQEHRPLGPRFHMWSADPNHD
ncbi:hypothetical protein J2Y48_002495 [Mycoplana sp. BE70]|uniref:hypothetical protein n=1 Tax=Mycoplana sp. BE70 TaxID=2817775 RepID=UPI00286393E0|nr:hypothetical protein [Mycoplana sp. BE70]MDR6757199.1 hypothetical protein [Mycoplana sp. BE70]